MIGLITGIVIAVKVRNYKSTLGSLSELGDELGLEMKSRGGNGIGVMIIVWVVFFFGGAVLFGISKLISIQTLKQSQSYILTDDQPAGRVEWSLKDVASTVQSHAQKVAAHRPQAGHIAPEGRRFCQKCGAPLAPDSKFCTRCGEKVDRRF